MLFLSLILTLGLIAAIAIVLKKHHQLRHSDLAERHQSLPPLSVTPENLELIEKQAAESAEDPVVSDTRVSSTSVSEKSIQVMAASAPPDSAEPPMAESPMAEPPMYVQQTQERQERHEPALHTYPPHSPSADTHSTPEHELKEDKITDWKEQCRQFRQELQFELALACSDQAWPQSQGFEQAAITLRAAIKHEGGDNNASMEQWLQMLYRTAAEYSLLYDKIPGQPDQRWQTINQLYSQDSIRAIQLPWEQIGAEELKLLTKTDRKLLLQQWGEPRQHISARQYHLSSTPNP